MQARTAGNAKNRPSYRECQWPTARAEDSESCGNHPGAVDSLTGATSQWQTPRAYSHGEDSNAPGLTGLDVQARGMYPEEQRYGERFQNGTNSPSSPPDPETGTPGPGSSSTAPDSPLRSRLNPAFVEWLMGTIPGWTDLEPLATGSFRWWQRSHSVALRRLLGS